jgi:imidazolonepropionase-like amidohydrolase
MKITATRLPHAVLLLAIIFLAVAPTAPAQYRGLQELYPPTDVDPNQVIALVGATLIDGLGGPVVEDSVIIVRGNKIVSAGTRSANDIPAGARVVDVSKYSVLPGLLDAHFHTGSGADMHEIPSLFLSHGVTTARDPGRPIEVYYPLRDSDRPAPRLFVTGPHFDQSPPAWPNNAVILSGPSAARQAVDRYVAQGASAIKVYFRLSLESIKATCAQADAHGIPVTAHLELVNASDAIRAGMDGIEHITSFGTDLAEPDIAQKFRTAVDEENEARQDGRYRLWATLDLENSRRAKSVLDLLVKNNVYVSPTLATFERRGGDNNVAAFHVEGFRKMMEFVGMCHRAGATVVTGSHTWSGHVKLGWAYQREMELLVESGLTPMEVIQASTMSNARFFGCAERLGSIEPGKLADFVFVEGEPHKDIKAMYNVRGVMLNGQFVYGSDIGATFSADNLVAWCIVPFDSAKRGPADRAAMLDRLGFKKVAYDWRAEHVPTFEQEILEYRKRGLDFFAFWDWHPDMEPLIQEHGIHPQIWKTAPSPSAASQADKVAEAAKQLLPLVETAGRLGCKFGLYNHGGWGGEPENLVAVCQHLRKHHKGQHVGIVYNFHHGHEHIGRFNDALALMMPHLLCLNINGMNDGANPKIVTLGEGAHERQMLEYVRDSGYRGPIGILDHRPETDTEISLRANLEGLKRLGL